MVAYAQERDLNSLFVKLPHEDEATMFENDLKGLNYQYVFEFWRKNSLLLKFQTLTFFFGSFTISCRSLRKDFR